jgi:hypothetical protein
MVRHIPPEVVALRKLTSPLALLVAATVLAATDPAPAMEWTTTSRGLSTVIQATGDIEPGDDQKLRDLVASIDRDLKGIVQREEEFRFRPTIEFQSPGGNLFTGLQLGIAISELGLRTRVPEGNACLSACTYAFLGGSERRVLGHFGVHAVSSATDEIEASMLDDVQEISAVLVGYVRDMVGVSDMAEASLKVRAADIYEVSDAELRDWKIVTHVSRPSQRFESAAGPLSLCDDEAWRQEIIPHDVICTDLTVGRNYIDIGEAIATIRDRVDAAALDEEQARFEKYWQGCETAWMAQLKSPQQIRPEVEACMREAFASRAAELGALKKFHEISVSEPAKSGWKATGN